MLNLKLITCIAYVKRVYENAHEKKSNIYYPCYLFNYFNVKQVIFWNKILPKKKVLEP